MCSGAASVSHLQRNQRGECPLASRYRGPDNVAGPLLGHLNLAVAVVSAVPVPRSQRGFNLEVQYAQHSTINILY